MTFRCCLALTLTFGLTIAHWIEPPIPKFLHVCEKSDFNLTECLKTSIETIRPVLMSGIKNVEIPSLDPLEIGHLFKSEKISDGIHVRAQNAIVMGILKFKINNVEAVKHGKLYKIDVTFPKLQVEGACDINGKIEDVDFPFVEACSFVITFNNSLGNVRARFSHVPDGWLTQTDKIDIKITTHEFDVRLYDLANSRRILNHDSWIEFFKKDFEKMNKELIPLLEKVLQHQLKEVLNKLLGNFSYSTVFPL